VVPSSHNCKSHLPTSQTSSLRLWHLCRCIHTLGHWPVYKFELGCLVSCWWQAGGREIGQVEAAVVELAALWLVQGGWHDAHVKIHCDNTSVISSFWKGHLHNSSCNNSLACLSSYLSSCNLAINPAYIPSTENKADHLFRGHGGTPDIAFLPVSVSLKYSLSYLSQYSLTL